MLVGDVHNSAVGFALFDAWLASVEKFHKDNKDIASPLVDAAFKAFDAYAATVETQNNAQIAGLAGYVLNPQGTGAKGLSSQDLAPFLALNVMA